MIFAAIPCRLHKVESGPDLLKRYALGLAVAAVTLSMSGAGLACEDLRPGPRGKVASVTDGDTVVLDNGLVIRLIGMQSPKLPLGREDFPAWPKAEEAKARLEAMVLGQPIELRHGGETRDRHDRVLGQMFVVAEPPLWVQRQMVVEGLARVYSFPDNRACLAELLAAESRARTMKLGIWADPYYTVRRADRPAAIVERAGQYELVEGRVLLAEKSGGRVFLNFGRYWKEDFTAVIDGRALRLFADSGLDPVVLEGALVRIRGWVDDRDGPRIEVTHPEQIEVLAAR
ncbi:MAG: thermonuclease family protein [Hyphomicrobiales bacterium]|nr:MAG: thermonuclease family protein [Hyphomicrobiales bacterium]